MTEKRINHEEEKHENVTAVGSELCDHGRAASEFAGENYSYRLRSTGCPDRGISARQQASEKETAIHI